MASVNKRTREAGESLGFLVVAGLILVVLNVLGVVWFGRIDCTEKRLFSLSDGSERLARSLTDRLEVTAYFTEDLPPPFNATERYVRDILSEYEAASRGKISARFVNAEPDSEGGEEATEEGVRRVAHQVIEDNSVSVKEGYRGVVLRYLDKKEVLPVIEDTSGLEYRITTAIKKMVGEKAKVAVLAGYDGPTPTEGLSSLRALLPTYELVEVESSELDAAEYAAALIVGPAATISERALADIDRYVMNGGNLGVFGGTMKVELEGQNPAATPVDTGINALITKYGVRMRNGILADAQSAQVPLQTRLGIPILVPHPPIPQFVPDQAQSEHPVLFRLNGFALPFVSPLELTDALDASEDVNVTVLAESTELSWVLDEDRVDLAPRDRRQWQAKEDGPMPMMVAVEGVLPSAFGEGAGMSSGEGGADTPGRSKEEVRLLVVGGAFFLRDELLPQANPRTGERQVDGRVAFALNSIDWLAQDSDLIAIRAKNVEDPPIERPADVVEAETAQQEAAQQAAIAQREGDREGVEAAVEEANRAEEEAKAALESWKSTEALYQWGNMLGIPLALALFGVIRWQLRSRRRQNMKL